MVVWVALSFYAFSFPLILVDLVCIFFEKHSTNQRFLSIISSMD
jgi:hypothetical protein